MNLDLVCEGFDMSSEIQVDMEMPQTNASLGIRTGFRLREERPMRGVGVGHEPLSYQLGNNNEEDYQNVLTASIEERRKP